MRVTKVTLRKVNMHKVCALASVVIDDALVVHDLRVVNGEKGVFVAMPSRKLPSGGFRDVCHPITPEAREAIQEAVMTQVAAEGGIQAFAVEDEGPAGN